MGGATDTTAMKETGLERELEELKKDFGKNEAQIKKACGKSIMSYPAINAVMEIVAERDYLRQQLSSKDKVIESYATEIERLQQVIGQKDK